MQNKLLFALSLCRKAGALVMGFDAVKDSVNQGNAYLVLCACDLSPATRERVVRFCEKETETADLPFTRLEISAISKKPAGVFAVTDENLAVLCRKNLNACAASVKEERP